jgi:hypothetical protein
MRDLPIDDRTNCSLIAQYPCLSTKINEIIEDG